MRSLISGLLNIIFPSSKGRRRISWKYLTIMVLLPIAAATATVGCGWNVRNPGILAASFGVLGGLLFAHAIFVFQLRSSYDARNIEPPKDAAGNNTQEDLRVRPLIDQMFTGVLYSSLIALTLTLFTGIAAAMMEESQYFGITLSAITLALTAHLVGCIWHVISATTTAYATLKKHDNLTILNTQGSRSAR